MQYCGFTITSIHCLNKLIHTIVLRIQCQSSNLTLILIIFKSVWREMKALYSSLKCVSPYTFNVYMGHYLPSIFLTLLLMGCRFKARAYRIISQLTFVCFFFTGYRQIIIHHRTNRGQVASFKTPDLAENLNKILRVRSPWKASIWYTK